jgi:predicted nucleic acid-binding protein
VLDASATLSWCFEEQPEDLTRWMLRALKERGALVPAIWTLEVPNVLFTAERRGRIGRVEVARFIEMLRGLPIAVSTQEHGLIPDPILALSHGHQLTTYDAAYLDLALRQGASLATFDRALRKAADGLGIDLLPSGH